MTWPQYQRRQCTIQGFTVSLSPHEAEILFLLMVRYPQPITTPDLIEMLWPNPDDEPEHSEKVALLTLTCLSNKIGSFRLHRQSPGKRSPARYTLAQTPMDMAA